MTSHKANQLQETRKMIIKTAKKLFMESGYRAVSTRQIADACGLTQPALYHHFADKQSLYVEVMRTVCEGTQKALERIIKREQAISECLYQIVYYMIVNHPDDLSTMFHDIRQEMSPESQQLIQKCWFQAYMAPVISVFEAGQKDGRLRDSGQFGIDPVMSARLLLGLINQSLMVSPVPNANTRLPEKKGWDQSARMLVNLMLHGLAEPGKP
ncbi:TetR/AcrR family transcriptional regulator [Paenibacillus nasutitermitis]|uniref:TetR family transcriptional regulator n=1 Tax=Paenibacillus nasutitermitis TaxID=1652958 RepID=A0A916Z5K1_9BACL|nr:TetR/AcrR family transcriptional regulator [Paenibacillus nasutitermitis]GGD74925.1 TetR family transcriptional regulator [Paenibacillus nasutitermitis]